MIFRDLHLAFRHLLRQKFNSTLHIIGLTLGMSVCLLIGLFLRYELSFDAYHDKADRTYRVNSVWTDSGKKSYHYSTPMPLAEALRSGVTGLENVALTHPQQKSIIEVNPQKRFLQEHILVVEPDFLDVFKVESVSGDPYQTLRHPYQALLTETTAKKLFGNEDPIGKIFKLRNEFDITVTGVIRDFPANTHLPASILLSFAPNENFLRSGPKAWSYVSGTETFVVVPPGYDLKNLDAQLKILADKNINSDPNVPKFSRSDFDLQPLTDIHFNATYSAGGQWVQAINSTWLLFFGFIGIAVLALACINFMNLSTAQALTRAKEVGVRKSVGAGRFRLIGQFLAEVWLLAIISGIFSIALTQIFLPAINTMLGKGIVFAPFQSPLLILILVAGILLTGFLAGIYPAWVIARFNPASTLKTGSTTTGDHGSSFLRKSLVVVQFTISAGLLIAVLLISKQVDYLRNQNLGFEKENIVNVEIKNANKIPIIANDFKSISSVKDVAFATATPSNDQQWGTVMSRISRDDPGRQRMTLIFGDDHFCKMYGLKLKAGRYLEATDTNYVSRSVPEERQIMKSVVNEKLIKDLEFKSNEEAIGARVWIGWNSGRVEIVGVVADFNTGSLHSAITPTLITQSPPDYGQAGIKLEAGANTPQAIAAIESAWKKSFPEGIFEFKFLDEQIDSFYKAEERLYNLFKIFAGLAMLISCLGLWGLATFSAQQRTKEIGIRKVLGASVNTIVMLLSRDFVLMVVIAIAISSPLAYYLVYDWLQTFAYHIGVEWGVFIFAGLASLVITLLTVSIQALRAAFTNPVNSLRNE